MVNRIARKIISNSNEKEVAFQDKGIQFQRKRNRIQKAKFNSKQTKPNSKGWKAVPNETSKTIQSPIKRKQSPRRGNATGSCRTPRNDSNGKKASDSPKEPRRHRTPTANRMQCQGKRNRNSGEGNATRRKTPVSTKRKTLWISQRTHNKL